MCGIVGVAGHISPKEKKVFADLLYIDGLRGQHSTGVLAVNYKNNRQHMFKRAEPALYFMQEKGFDCVLAGNSRLLIGHNRFATVGTINATNAHPFKKKHITGVHNGTLRRQSLLPAFEKFSVDSENIMHAISEEGIEETAKKLCGAYALVWWNSEDETLNFFRNAERTLYYCFSKDRKTLVYASEAPMLDLAVKRRGLVMEDALWYPAAGHHVSFNMSRDIKGDMKERESVCELETYVDPIQQGWFTEVIGRNKDGTDNKVVSISKRSSEVVKRLPLFVEGGDSLLMSPDILKQISKTCGWCDADLPDLEEKDQKTVWYDSATLLCKECGGFW